MKFLFSQFRPIPSYFALFRETSFSVAREIFTGSNTIRGQPRFFGQNLILHRLASSGRFTTTRGRGKKLATAYKEILKLTPPSSLPTKFTNYFWKCYPQRMYSSGVFINKRVSSSIPPPLPPLLLQSCIYRDGARMPNNKVDTGFAHSHCKFWSWTSIERKICRNGR